MPYKPAKDVHSPRDSLQLIRVLSDPGPSKPDKFVCSWALGFWEDRPVILTRWNGTDAAPVGTPQSRGLPVWHVMDDALYDDLAAMLAKHFPQHAEFIRMFLSMRAAGIN